MQSHIRRLASIIMTPNDAVAPANVMGKSPFIGTGTLPILIDPLTPLYIERACAMANLVRSHVCESSRRHHLYQIADGHDGSECLARIMYRQTSRVINITTSILDARQHAVLIAFRKLASAGTGSFYFGRAQRVQGRIDARFPHF